MSRCELTVKDEFNKLTEKTMRTSHFKANAIMKAAVLMASILLFGVSASFGQQTVNLTAAPTTTTLPDGTTVPMWGYFCGTAVTGATATCAALNPLAVATTTTPAPWSPVVITVPYVAAATGGSATSLTINLTNNLSFTPTGATTANAIPTSIVIVGQVGGGLGVLAQRTTTASPSHTDAQGCVTWFIADPTSTPPGAPCTTSTPLASPPVQGNRVQSFSTEVAGVAACTPVAPATTCTNPFTALTWSALRPGTYLLESGTHPSIQVPMGLIGMLVVTTAPSGTTAGTAYPAVGTAPAVPYNAELPLEFSEIDPVQNKAVNTAVNTAGFSETKVWDGHVGQCGNPSSPVGVVNTCYPPAVNYTPFYYLINGVAFNKTNAAASLFPATAGVTAATPPAPVTTGITGTVLVRLVNAGLRMHVPSIVGSQTAGFTGAGVATTAANPVGGFTLIAEDGNVIPGVAPAGATTAPVAPRVQTDVFMAAGKTFDVMINAVNVPASTAALPVYDRELSLSANSSARDSGMLAYINVNGIGLPAATAGTGAFAAAKANPDTYSALVAGQTFTVADTSKGVIANDVNVYGVTLLTQATNGVVVLNANGTFTYTPNAGSTATSDSFTYCANNGFVAATTTTAASCSSADLTATVALGASTLTGNPTAITQNYTAKMATYIKIPSPGLLLGNTDPNNLALTVVPSTSTSLVIDKNGGFNASGTAGSTLTFSYTVQNSQGKTATGTANVTFPTPSNLQVKVVDAQAYSNCNGLSACISALTPITDYRWIIEEDKTFWVDPNCTTNASITAPGCPHVVGAGGTIPTQGVQFHTSTMDYVATGCTGPKSCESGQTVLDTNPTSPTFGRHVPAACDLGNGACRTTVDPTTGGTTASLPSSVHLDPTKRYYISVLPGDAGDPFPAYVGQPTCTSTGANPGDLGCGHTMGGAQVPPACNVLVAGCTATSTTAFAPVTVLVLPTPLPTGKLSLIVFEDDFPLNGEQDAGGGIDVLSPNEPGLGGFEIILWDTYGSLGDVTGQDTHDMFNQPLSNSLAGTTDPSTGFDACPISAQATADPTQAGITGRIVTCPKYESDGKTLSPLAGQAVVANLMADKFSVQAYPGADRIARGEEWLQTNTLDGQHPHDSFIRVGEPGYFQEYGPAGYHVSIGFVNPKIINDRHDAVCAGSFGAVGPCTNIIEGQVDVQRLSRTPDQRLYPSGSRDALAWTQCWVSLGDPDAEDFMFTKCDANGNFKFTGVPGGNWRLTIGDQWNDQIIDGLSTPANVGCVPTPPATTCSGGISDLKMGQIGTQQWQANVYTRTFIDDNKNGIRDPGEIGIPLVYTMVHYRDGSRANVLTTDFDGVANFNETFPLFNWYVVTADSGRYKTTGIHTVYDAGGPADGSTYCGGAGRPCGTSTAYNFLANTYEAVPLPADLSVPGAVYCAAADCTAEATSFAAGTAIPSSSTASTGRIDPPWVAAEGWSGETSQGNWIEFGKAPFASCNPALPASATNFCVSVPNPLYNPTAGGTTPSTIPVGENGGIHGLVKYAATRPFDDASQMIEQPWAPNVPRVTMNLYQEGFAPDGVTPTLKLVDTTQTSSWDDWAQGFYPGSTAGSGTGAGQKPYMSCPGQGTATGANADLFFFTLFDQPNYLNYYSSLHGGPALSTTTLPYNSQYKCYDAMHIWNQVQPAPYDGMYSFPSVLGINPTTGKQMTPAGYINPITGAAPTMTGTNCTVCVANPDTTDVYRVGTPMLPPGKYVVEVIMPPGYEVEKEEDKNLLIGDNYIAPATQQFAGLGGDIFIIPDQASVASLYDESGAGYNPTNYQNATTNEGYGNQLSLPGYPGFQDPVWPCVGENRVVPDYLSLFPQVQETAPFAGATRPLCDRKEVTLPSQMSVSAKFYIFTSTHIASHFTGVITDDFTSEFDPFAPQFGEKFAPPNLPVATRDYLGNEVSRVYSDHWGIYDGLNFSSWDVNPPNITGYSPSMMVQCMNDYGPILDTTVGSPTFGKMINDPLYNPAYSDFCYEEPYMPGTTTYLDTPVVPTQAFVGAGYNNPDCAYPDATPAISEVDGTGIGPWVSGPGQKLTITALGNATVANSSTCTVASTSADVTVNNFAYAGPSASVAPFDCKTVSRHYGFGGTAGTVALVGSDGVSHPLTGVGWSDTTITGNVPAGLPACTIQQQAQYGGSAAQCGQLVIKTANTAGAGAPSNARQSIDTVTVTIGGKAPTHVAASGTIQSAIDAAAPGDLIIVDPTCNTGTTVVPCTTAGATKSGATHTEMLIMWKPVRLQGAGAASTIINANAIPAGKLLDPWRRHINCLFGLTIQGVPYTAAGGGHPYDPSGTYSCPDTGWQNFTAQPNVPQIDRLPLEATVGWDATLNGNLAELLQEPSLMGAYEGAGITVLGKGLDFHGAVPWNDGSEAGAFPTGTTLLTGVVANPGSTTGAGGLLVGDANPLCKDGTNGTNRFPSNFICNPSSIDGLTITNSSQGGGGIFVHGWAHFLEIANNRIYNNAGTLSGGISVGQGEFAPPYIQGGATNAAPGSCSDGTGLIDNQHLPMCLQLHPNVHNNMITDNSSIGDELFSATLSGGGGVSFCTGNDYYKFNYNWVCGNISAGEGGGLVHLGEIYNGDIEHNSILFNQSSNPTIPTNGGGIMVQGTPDTDPVCGTIPDADCPPGLSDGTGPGLVINANLIQGNMAESGSGGGIRLQQVNGTEVATFGGIYLITAADEGHTVTITTPATAVLPAVGDSVTIAGVSVAGYNGTFTVTRVGTRRFTYLDTTAGLGRGTGGTFTDTTAAGTAQPITAATETAATTVTITSGLSPTAGDRVTITGVTPAGYNGTFTVTCTPASVTSTTCPAGPTAAGTFTYTDPRNLLTAGTGGTVTDSNPNQATAVLWHDVTITNNIIVNNVAGWDGAGISLQDALNVNIINNTIMHNDSLATSGVLTNSIGTPQASSNAGNCTMSGPTGTNTASCPQSAGVTSTPNSSLLTTTFVVPISCPAGHPHCTGFSNPILLGDVISQNRSFYVGVGTVGNGTLNQQNQISLYSAFTTTLAPTQATTGACSTGVTYWDVGVRGDRTLTGHQSGFTMTPVASYVSDSNPVVIAQYCNGSRVPPECTVANGCGGLHGFGVPPGIPDALAGAPLFSLVPSATVDEGNNWINVSWGPLSLSNTSVTGGTYGNYGGGPALGNYAPAPTGSPLVDFITCRNANATGVGCQVSPVPGLTITLPRTDFYGNPRPDPNPGQAKKANAGAVETP
jgi:hypothetical protein